MLKYHGAPKKSVIETGIVMLTQTEVTLDDITKNLTKNSYLESLDLANVYEFINTVNSSHGKSGFVEIKRANTKRKRSSEPKTKKDKLVEQRSLSKNSKKVIKHKSPSPFVVSPTKLSKNYLRSVNSHELISIDERGNTQNLSKKRVEKKMSSNKSQLGSPKNVLAKKKIKSLSKKKEQLQEGKSIKNGDSAREKAPSPYSESIFLSARRLPLLQSTKKIIKVLKYDKKRKKSVKPKQK